MQDEKYPGLESMGKAGRRILLLFYVIMINFRNLGCNQDRFDSGLKNVIVMLLQIADGKYWISIFIGWFKLVLALLHVKAYSSFKESINSATEIILLTR